MIGTSSAGTAAAHGNAIHSGAGYDLEDVGVVLESATGRHEILRNISMKVAPSEVVGIVGRSGTGKTTLLRVLGGLLTPTSGSAKLDGVDIRKPPATVVTVFQDYGNALLPWRTLARNVELPLERGFSKAERRERALDALQMVGLDHRAVDFPWRLSGGMQQRVQIARALALQPKVLLMDEPFGALDAMTKADMQDQLLAVKERTGSTIIFITHDIEEAIYLSDRVMMISGAPGTIPLQIETNLPANRNQVETREMPRFLEIRHQLHAALREK